MKKKYQKFLFLSMFGITALLNTNFIQAQWIQTNMPYDPMSAKISSFTAIGTSLFVAKYGGGAFRSINSGISWTSITSGISWPSNPNSLYTWSDYINTIISVGGDILIGTYGDGILRTTDNGLSWTSINSLYLTFLDSRVKKINAIFANNTNLFVGTDGVGVFLSTNNGSSWASIRGDITKNVRVFMVNGEYLFAGTDGGGVFRSTNNGLSWIPVNSGLSQITGTLSIRTFALSGSNLFVGTDGGGVYRSTNNGTSWTEVNLGLPYTSSPFIEVRTLVNIGSNLFVGLDGKGVYLSTNNGSSWSSVNLGLSDLYISSLFINDTYLFAGIHANVYRRPLSELITNIEYVKNNLPSDYVIEQNYPNPFNPKTTIKYSIPKQTHIILKVYNLQGKEVTTLINEDKYPGNFEVEFDARNLPTGVYFYRLQAGSFHETKKLLLMK